MQVKKIKLPVHSTECCDITSQSNTVIQLYWNVPCWGHQL